MSSGCTCSWLSLVLQTLLAVQCCWAQGAATEPRDVKSGRQLVEKLANNFPRVIYTVDVRGFLKPQQIATFELDRVRQFYDAPTIVRELELLGQQRTEYESLLKEWKDRLTNLTDEYANEGDPTQRNEGLRRLRALDQEMQDRFEGLLVPHQVDRLHQIQARIVLRLGGFKTLLLDQATWLGFSLSPKEVKGLRDRAREQAEGASAEYFRVRDKAVQYWLEPLPVKDRDRVLEVWQGLLGGESTRMEELVYFLSEEMTIEPDPETPRIGSRFPQYELTFEGLLARMELPPSADQGATDEIQQLLSMLAHGDLQVALEMTAAQTSGVEEIRQAFWNSILGIRDAYRVKKSEQPQATEALEGQERTEKEDASRGLLSQLRGLLLPHQIEKLEQLHAARWRIVRGPVRDLLRGSLRDELKLAESAVEALDERRAHAAKIVTDAARDLENAAIEGLRGALTSENQQVFDRLLGEPLEVTPCGLLLLMKSLAFE